MADIVSLKRSEPSRPVTVRREGPALLAHADQSAGQCAVAATSSTRFAGGARPGARATATVRVIVIARDRQGLLRRPRPQGDDRAPRRCRPRQGLLQGDDGSLLGADAGDRHAPEAGHRRGRRPRHRRRLPAGRQLRPRHRLRPRHLLHARRQYRPVLLDADGGAVAQRAAQAGDGDAADRRDDRRQGRRAISAWSTASCRRDYLTQLVMQICADHCFEIAADAEDRQGGVLPPGRDEPRRRLSLRVAR